MESGSPLPPPLILPIFPPGHQGKNAGSLYSFSFSTKNEREDDSFFFVERDEPSPLSSRVFGSSLARLGKGCPATADFPFSCRGEQDA